MRRSDVQTQHHLVQHNPNNVQKQSPGSCRRQIMPAKQPGENMASLEGEVSELDYEVVLLDIEGTTTPITFVKVQK